MRNVKFYFYCTESESGKVSAMQILQMLSCIPTLKENHNFRSNCNVQSCNTTRVIKREQLTSDFKSMQMIKENAF